MEGKTHYNAGAAPFRLKAVLRTGFRLHIALRDSCVGGNGCVRWVSWAFSLDRTTCENWHELRRQQA
jgi:hypothetical protein